MAIGSSAAEVLAGSNPTAELQRQHKFYKLNNLLYYIMTYSNADTELIRFVQLQINTGATRIKLPGYLIAKVGDEVIEEIGRAHV